MRIVIGTGKNRKIYDLVHGSIVRRSSETEQRAYIGNVQSLLGVV
jgi:hypothetical protein